MVKTNCTQLVSNSKKSSGDDDDDNDDDDNDDDLFDQFIIYYTAIATWSKATRATSIPAQSQRADL